MKSSTQQQKSSTKGRKKPTENVSKAAPRKSVAVPNHDPLIDDNTRRDIVGVVLIIIGIVLMLAAALPQDENALVTSAVSRGMHLLFGVGCYVLPFILAGIGVTFLLRFKRERVPTRSALGFAIIYIALLGFIALFTPVDTVAGENIDLVFSETALTNHGGYIGAALAWTGLRLFGPVISGVILSGIMFIGILVIGFSISEFIDKIRGTDIGHFQEIRMRHRLRKQNSLSDTFEGMNPGETLKRSILGKVRGESQNFDSGLVRPARPLGASHEKNLEENAFNEASYIRRNSPTANKRRIQEAQTRTLSDDPYVTQMFDALDTNDEDSLSISTNTTQARTTALPKKRRTLGKKAELSSDETIDNASLTHVFKDDVSPHEPENKTHVQREAHNNPRNKDNQTTQQVDAFKSSSKEKELMSSSRPGSASPCVVRPQEGFELPSMNLLSSSKGDHSSRATETELADTAALLQETLGDFGIMAEVVGWVAGPTVTLFKVDLPAGVRVNRVTALNDDIALALAAPGVRIFAPIPGTNFVGIEVPNKTRETVYLSDVLVDAEPGPLQIAIGKDVEGNSIISDLARMPHLLIGGTTGSGKSVSINAMIMSILMRATPAEVRFIMIDPKRVEFTPYNGIPHLYVPVVTEAKEAASALSWGVAEMERRLKVFSKVGARNIGQFNAKVQEAKAAEEAALAAGEETQHWEYDDELPYIVIIIDELADLMMNVGKEIEFSISRIAQLARAAGIHLIVATQRPSTNVVTGLIKANITNRIAFNVASGIDSRVILDTPGAENLIGLGDLLLSKPELAKPVRIQGCFVSEKEINAVVEKLKEQGDPDYHSEILSVNTITLGDSSPAGRGSSESDDPLVWEAADIVVSSGLGSTSNIQRRLKVGYARAGRIMDQLEEKGIVGPANGSRPREVLVDELELESLKAFEAHDE